MKKTKPEPLPAEFTKKGFYHKLVERQGFFAVYKRWNENIGEDYAHFEIIHIRINKEWVAPNGNIVPEKEAYPSSEKWGQDGFTCLTRERALDKMKEMVSEGNEKR